MHTLHAIRSVHGNNSSANTIDDKSKASITDLVGNLTGGAASSLGSLGSGLLSTGANAFTGQAQLSQERLQNWMNSILGQGTTGALLGGESIGLGAAGKAAGLGF